MITEKEILNATEETLPQIAGKVLQPENNKHVMPSKYGSRGLCLKCGKYLDWTRWKEECISVDPIALTWDNAMKYRNWAVEEFGKFSYYRIIKLLVPCSGTEGLNKDEWIIIKALPIHYIKASCLCKITSIKENKT